MKRFPDGLVAVVKHDCPTCTLIEPVLRQLAAQAKLLTIYTQDDPLFPAGAGAVVDDTALENSYHLDIDIVPTLVRFRDGKEVARTFGWDRLEWESLTGIRGLGAGLPEARPGCGSKTREPGMDSRLAVRYGDVSFKARSMEIPSLADDIEFCYERGWSDGLPVVPPTRERVLEMLRGAKRDPREIIGVIPPDRVECTVEKAAINAVMAGCKPEYFSVVLAAVEAALIPDFGLHGILCTTNFVGPVVMVNGPIARAIGMNSKVNALGQGNRANATIGRALQLVVRNVGGGRPGEIDRAVLGNPGKYTFCFAEDEDEAWESFAVERGFARTSSTVTLFCGEGVTPVMDEISRTPESLARSFASVLRCLHHPKQVSNVDALLVVTPEHAGVFHRAGWSKQRLKDELHANLRIPARELLRGYGGIDAGLRPSDIADLEASIPKFRPTGINIVRAGGGAGKFSGIISGLGSMTINPVTKEIAP